MLSYIALGASIVALSSAQSTPYQPDVPFSYSECYANPANATDRFIILDGISGQPFVNDNGIIVLAQLQGDVLDWGLHFRPTVSGNSKVYDLVLNETGTPSYVAIYNDGGLGFEPATSNGTTWKASGSRTYLTTVWSLQCNGGLTAGIPGGQAFDFFVAGDRPVTYPANVGAEPTELMAYSQKYGPLDGSDEDDSEEAIAAREVIQRELFGSMLQKREAEVSPRCADPNKRPQVKPNARPPGTNGCGPGWAYGLANFVFEECCDGHDLCYDDCSGSYVPCNRVFNSCMLKKCRSLYALLDPRRYGCIYHSRFYNTVVSSPIGRRFFHAAGGERCDCVCKYEGQNPCGCDRQNPYSSPAFSQPNEFASEGWSACKSCCSAIIEQLPRGTCTCCVFNWQYNDPANNCCPRELSERCCKIACP